LAEKRERHPRAYMAWCDDEDRTLEKLVRTGMTVARITGELQRNGYVICSRVVNFSLLNQLTPRERDRFLRIGFDFNHPAADFDSRVVCYTAS
jgi:hypothetical protein